MSILINDNTAVVQYTATSGQTVFVVPYEFFEVGDLKVYNGDTLLAYNASPSSASQYSVIGAGVTGGGSITLGAPGASVSNVITISRDIPIKRVTDFPSAGPFNIEALNTELDKQIAMMQELERDIDRSIAVPLGESILDLPSAADRANRFLAFDSSGDPIISTGTGADAGLRTDLAASNGTALIGTSLAGFTVADFVEAMPIPAILTAGSDQSAVLQDALNAADTAVRRVVEINQGTFSVKDVEIPSGTWLRGQGMGRTILARASALTNAILKFATGASEVIISDLTVDGLSAADAKSLISMGAHGSNIRFERVRFQNDCERWALRGDPTARFDNLKVLDCEFVDCQSGCVIILAGNMSVAGSTGVDYIGNRATRCGGNLFGLRDYETGIASYNRWDFWRDCKFNFNSILDCANTGTDGPIPVEMWSVSGFQQIGNYIDSGTRGLTAGAGTQNGIISQNVIKNQTLYAMEGGRSRNMQIFGNVAVNCRSFYQDTSLTGDRVENLQIDSNIIIGTGLTSYDATAPVSPIWIGTNANGTVPISIRVSGNRLYDLEYARNGILLFGQKQAATVTFAGGGTGATGTVTLKGVAGSVLRRGFGYTSAPTASFVSVDGNGAGATGTVTVSGGLITGLTVTAAGSGYTLPPEVVLSGGGGKDGEIELLMGIDTVTPSGGTGYSDSTFTVSGNGKITNASGTFTQTAGVPTAATVTVAGSGFGRGSDFIVENNCYSGRTFASTTNFITAISVGDRLRSSNNIATRTANYNSSHHNQAGAAIAFAMCGSTSPLGSPSIVSTGDKAEMLALISSGNFSAFGVSEAPTARYGLRFSNFQMAGAWSTGPILINDSSGTSIIEDFDARGFTGSNSTLLNNVNSSLMFGLKTGEALIRDGAYINLGLANPGGRRRRLHYAGGTGTRTIKILFGRTTGDQTHAIFKVNYQATNNNGTPQGNEIVVTWGNVSSATAAPFIYTGNGTVTTTASALSGSQREATITLPTSNNEFLVTIDAEVNERGTRLLSDFSVKVG